MHTIKVFVYPSQAGGINVFYYDDNTDLWEQIMIESGDQLSFDGEEIINYNGNRDRYFYYVSIDESLYIRFLEHCSVG